VTAESSPYCGQTGRVCRVFWRDGEPWALLRSRGGLLLALPWAATDLPAPALPGDTDVCAAREAVLLSPAALLALGRFLHHRGAGTAAVRVPQEGGDDDQRAR
jgi:hypothetical protein